MPDDFNNTLENLRQMLSSEAGQNSLREIASSFGLGNVDDTAPPSGPPSTPSPINGMDLGLATKVVGAISSLQNTSGANFQLLYALRPYLSVKRKTKFESALKIVQLSKLPQIKDMF